MEYIWGKNLNCIVIYLIWSCPNKFLIIKIGKFIIKGTDQCIAAGGGGEGKNFINDLENFFFKVKYNLMFCNIMLSVIFILNTLIGK